MQRPTNISIHTGLLSLLFGLLLAACGGVSPGETKMSELAAKRSGVSVAAYCEAFARQYVENHHLDLLADSVQVPPKSDWLRFLSNVFQPADSRFTAGYACRFSAMAGEDAVREFTVDILLTNTLRFAEHTQWERQQIVPITYLVDEARDRAGYGVFKYLEERADARPSGAVSLERTRAVVDVKTGGNAVSALERIDGHWHSVVGEWSQAMITFGCLRNANCAQGLLNTFETGLNSPTPTGAIHARAVELCAEWGFTGGAEPVQKLRINDDTAEVTFLCLAPRATDDEPDSP